MKFMKTVTRFMGKSKTMVKNHGPQIAAVAGVACFVAGTVYAIKETPNAMKKLEAKKALDKDMSKLQQAAVILPEYKKTIACATAGIAFTGLSWHLEAKYVAYLTAALSTAKEELLTEKKNGAQLLEAAKEVVGEEKTEEIKAKKEELTQEDLEASLSCGMPTDLIPYPFAFTSTSGRGGIVIWMTWRQFNERWRQCVSDLIKNDCLSRYDLYMNFQSPYLPNDTTHGWSKDVNYGHIYDNLTSEVLDWAEDTLAYTANVIQLDNGNQAGYEIVFHNDASCLD